MNPSERPFSVNGDLLSKDERSLETRVGRLRETVERRNEQENKLLEWLSAPGPMDRSVVQDLWLSLRGTSQEVDGETKRLIKERLKFKD